MRWRTTNQDDLRSNLLGGPKLCWCTKAATPKLCAGADAIFFPSVTEIHIGVEGVNIQHGQIYCRSTVDLFFGNSWQLFHSTWLEILRCCYVLMWWCHRNWRHSDHSRYSLKGSTSIVNSHYKDHCMLKTQCPAKDTVLTVPLFAKPSTLLLVSWV